MDIEMSDDEIVLETAVEDTLKEAQPEISLSEEASNAVPSSRGASEIRTRSYQLEMLEESLKQNIIVIMETGSGKTHIAILRLFHEIESSPNTISWFLTPTVWLLRQQAAYLGGCLKCPVIPLAGEDAVDKWTAKAWDEILGQMLSGVVVSTHQVLYDALVHGFVRLGQKKSDDRKPIGLLIFDEAHHCVENHPAHRIMKDFYNPLLRYESNEEIKLPSILGLTASPVVRARPGQLATIEKNLHAVAKTPKINKDELAKYVHPPVLKSVYFTQETAANQSIIQMPMISQRKRLKPTLVTLPQAARSPQQPIAQSFDFDFDSAATIELESLGVLQNAPAESNAAFKIDFDSAVNLDLESLGVFQNVPVQSSAALKIDFDSAITLDLESLGFYQDEILTRDEVLLRTSTQAKSQHIDSSRIDALDYSITQPIVLTSSARPEFSASNPKLSLLLVELENTYANLSIEKDPYIIYLRASNSRRFDNFLLSKKTDCQNKIKSFVDRAQIIMHELGIWCTDFYISNCIRKYFSKSGQIDSPLAPTRSLADCNMKILIEGQELIEAEKTYISDALRQVDISAQTFNNITDEGAISSKLELLIQSLLEEYAHEDDPRDFSGLIFVEQRVAVAVLSEALSVHPLTKDNFAIGTLIGSSFSNARSKITEISELVCPPNQLTALSEFENGQTNLLISTSVAEEGIDIQACAVIICFSLPANLKSFIQRRGRARRKGSRYVLMFPGEHGTSERKLALWQQLEVEMKKAYEDDTPQRMTKTESTDSDEDGSSRTFQTSLALLTLESAIPKLHHFCNVIPRKAFMDTRPVFEQTKTIDYLIKCTVTLPASIAPELRRTTSSQGWRSRKRARQDAAFCAYIALYKAGLLDEHLLPITKESELSEDLKGVLSGVDKRPAKVSVVPQMEPWSEAWNLDFGFWETEISIGQAPITLWTPFRLPDHVASFDLFVKEDEILQTKIGKSLHRNLRYAEERFERWDDGMRFFKAFLQSLYWKTMKTEAIDFPYLFLPMMKTKDVIASKILSGVISVPANDVEPRQNLSTVGIIRDMIYRKSYILAGQGWVHGLDAQSLMPVVLKDQRYAGKQISDTDSLLEVVPLSLRRDFLNKDLNLLNSTNRQLQYLCPEYCRIDVFPFEDTRLAMFLPVIIWSLGIPIIAENLRNNLLAPCALPSSAMPLLCTAITCPSAYSQTNYQRLEFLGDSVLKYIISIQVLAEYPLWHEGYIGARKDQVVANSALARAAIAKNLSKWVVTKQFVNAKWKPHYLSDIMNDTYQQEERLLSTKVLADVVEALIGASYLSGSFHKSLTCIEVFNLGLKLLPMHDRIEQIYDTYRQLEGETPRYLADLESLLGYTFEKKTILIEAMTHPSLELDHKSMSYQRLEFLGDSILDMVVVDDIYKNGKEYGGKNYSHIEMHLYKSTVVNADFLAHLCMSFSTTAELNAVTETEDGSVAVVTGERKVHFRNFLRHQSVSVLQALQNAEKRHQMMRKGIDEELAPHPSKQTDATPLYPWVKLAGLEADKFLSDIVESVIGAVFVDSQGDFNIVRAVVERFGVLRVLRQLLRSNVNPWHPVTKLGMLAAKGYKTVHYDIEQEPRPNIRSGKRDWTCKVRLDQHVVASVDSGSSRTEVRTRAAEVAYKALTS